MKTFRMSYPTSVSTAVGELDRADPTESALWISGGQDLLGSIKDGIVAPDLLVNLQRVDSMRAVQVGGAGEPTTIGALATLTAIERDAALRAAHPMIAEAAESVATPQIRNQGTLGGNLCQRPRCWYFRNPEAVCLKKGGTECFAYGGLSKYNAILGGGPSYIVHPSDLAPALVASDAELELATGEGKDAKLRRVAAGAFFTLPSEADPRSENVLARGELVTAAIVPDRSGWRATYLKVRERISFDFALSAVACALRMQDGKVAEARLVLGGVAPRPWRCTSTEALLVGKALDEKTIEAARDDALAGAQPLEYNGYKVPMTKGLITKALRKLAQA